MSYIRPKPTIIEINGKRYNLLFTLRNIDELQETTQMSMTELITCLTKKRLQKDAVRCILKYLTNEEIEVEQSKIEYYSLMLIDTYIKQASPKKIEINAKKKEERDIKERINTENWLYIGKSILNYPEDEVLNMTLGKLITLYNEHALFNNWIKEDKEVSIDEAIPL